MITRQVAPTFVFSVAALNCEKSIQATVESIVAATRICGVTSKTELIVTDDGSTDDTYHKAKACEQEFEGELRRFHVRRNSHTLGMSSVFVDSAADSDRDFLIPAAGNNNMPINSWVKLMQATSANSVVLGYRRALWGHRPPAKALASVVLSKILLPLWGFNYRELTGSIVAPRTDILTFVPRTAGHGFAFFLIAGGELKERTFIEIWIELNDQRSTHPAKLPNPKYAWAIAKALISARQHAQNQIKRT